MTNTMDLVDSYGNHRMTDGHHDLVEDHPHTLKARAALEQRIKELERDAKRYRWLREQNEILASDTFYVGFDDQDEPDDIGWVGSDLDTVVDRAMSEAALAKAVEISQEYKLP